MMSRRNKGPESPAGYMPQGAKNTREEDGIKRLRPRQTNSDTRNFVGPISETEWAPGGTAVAEEHFHQPTTPPIRVRQRTTWTNEINQYVVQCYYQITKLETSKEPYSKELHRLVVEKFPSLRQKTVQNILDQRRSIFINNRLSADIINKIKHEVSVELGIQIYRETQEDTDDVSADDQIQPMTPKTEVEDEFDRNFLKYHGADPTAKPMLPKLKFKPQTRSVIKEVDKLIADKITRDMKIEHLHSILYTGAFTVISRNNQHIRENAKETDTERKKISERKHKLPAWEYRLNRKIESLRKDIGILTQSQNPSATDRVKQIARTLENRYRSHENPTIQEILDLLKQKLAAAAKRLKRYRTSNRRRIQNRQFSINQKQFYKCLEVDNNQAQNVKTYTPIDVDTIKEFWENTWSESVEHKRTKWLYDEKKSISNIKTMLNWKITTDELKEAIRKTPNWKAPGADKIHNFWFKQFVSTHEQLSRCYNHLLENPTEIPKFMVVGITYLLPKTNTFSDDPSQYRPITCLPTIYKILTSIITNKIYKHLETNKLLDEEQKGCRRGSRGCKEQLIIDSVIMTHAKRTKDSLHTAYIDYKKAFDSVPHSWLAEILEIYQIEQHITKFLQLAMTQWATDLFMNTPTNSLYIGHIEINRGIFQGDSLSPLWFCLALRPLTTLLNSLKKGYSLPHSKVQISHLWYMDDLKLFARQKNHLQDLLKAVGRFSSDIQMEFGLNKCKISAMEKGKWERHEGYEVAKQGLIAGMEEEDRYKYLGYLQARSIDQNLAKDTLKKTYFHRLRRILKTELNSGNTTKAINTYATSVLTYSFGVIKWTDTELEELDTKTRKEFRKARGHHPQSAIERFHLPRNQGGRGIPNIYRRHYSQIGNLREYFLEKYETSNIHREIVLMDKNISPLKLANRTFQPRNNIKTPEELKQQWRGKPLHGRYLASIESKDIDTKASTAYLQHGNLFVETEGFLGAIQDQVVPTRIYRKTILKERLDNTKCRMCGEQQEYLDHIIGGCSTMAPKAYLERHNRVAKIIHQKLRVKYMELEETEPYYQYEPAPVYETDSIKLYWNRKIITDKPIPNNIPDIVMVLKNEKTTYIIDIAVPLPHNITNTHAEKINKYLPLADEIKKMWKQDTVTIVPIVIGATGEIPKNLKTCLEKLRLNEIIYKQIQKSVILDTCHIVRRVLGENTFR